MKKIWFMMLMICAVGVFMACSNDDDENPQSNPITNCSVPAEAEIGTEVLVRGTGFDASLAKLSLKGVENVEIAIANPTFSASGVSFTIPMSVQAGDYTLVLSQNGVWELGKIKLTPAALPIIGLTVPEEAYVGKALSIGGNNFDVACKIYLVKVDDTTVKTELTITGRNNGLVCDIPATVAEGAYSLVLAQNGGEWILGEIALVKERRLKSMEVVVDFSAFNMGTMKYPYYLKYNAQGQVEKISQDEAGNDVWYNFTYSNGEISAVTGQDDEKYYPFNLYVEGNCVIKHKDVDLKREYAWNYTDDKLAEIKRVSNSRVTLALEWQKDNAVKVGDSSFTYDENQKVKGIDIAKCISYIMTQEYDGEIFYAELLGISGAKSVNLLKSFTASTEESEVEIPLTCKLDENSYLTSVSMEGVPEAYIFPITITLTYE